MTETTDTKTYFSLGTLLTSEGTRIVLMTGKLGPTAEETISASVVELTVKGARVYAKMLNDLADSLDAPKEQP